MSAEDQAPMVSCTKCLEATCTRCSHQHVGMTCAAHEKTAAAEQDAIALEQYKQDANVKNCPSCTISIEKRGGCRHMKCSRCAAHFCWECLASYDNHLACDDHIIQAHGGLYAPDFVQAAEDDDPANWEIPEEDDEVLGDEVAVADNGDPGTVGDELPENDWRLQAGWVPDDWRSVPHNGQWQ